MIMGIGIRKQAALKSEACYCHTARKIVKNAYLQHFVRTGLNAWNHMRWTKSRLLHFGEIILGISIQNDFSHRNQRKISMGPNLQGKRKVKKICLWWELNQGPWKEKCNRAVQLSYKLKNSEIVPWSNRMD